MANLQVSTVEYPATPHQANCPWPWQCGSGRQIVQAVDLGSRSAWNGGCRRREGASLRFGNAAGQHAAGCLVRSGGHPSRTGPPGGRLNRAALFPCQSRQCLHGWPRWWLCRVFRARGERLAGQEDPLLQQIESTPAIHHSLDQLNSGVVSFHDARAPRQRHSRRDGRQVLAQSGCK